MFLKYLIYNERKYIFSSVLTLLLIIEIIIFLNKIFIHVYKHITNLHIYVCIYGCVCLCVTIIINLLTLPLVRAAMTMPCADGDVRRRSIIPYHVHTHIHLQTLRTYSTLCKGSFIYVPCVQLINYHRLFQFLHLESYAHVCTSDRI